jgi:hypothetical protein
MNELKGFGITTTVPINAQSFGALDVFYMSIHTARPHLGKLEMECRKQELCRKQFRSCRIQTKKGEIE